MKVEFKQYFAVLLVEAGMGVALVLVIVVDQDKVSVSAWTLTQ